MNPSVDPQAVALLAGLELLCAVVLVWRGPASSTRGPLAVQGAALAGLVLVIGIADGEPRVVAVAILVLGLRAALLPALVSRGSGPAAAQGVPPARRVGTVPLLLGTAGLVVVAYLVARPLAAIVPGPAGRALPVGMSLVLVGFTLLVTGDRSQSQLVGFLVLDNGIATTAFLATGGVPLVVELGVSLDVLLVVLVLQVLGGRMALAFGGTDLDRLRELRD
jgi:hydrogenase-4 component E